jgi:hypothetical protein
MTYIIYIRKWIYCVAQGNQLEKWHKYSGTFGSLTSGIFIVSGGGDRFMFSSSATFLEHNYCLSLGVLAHEQNSDIIVGCKLFS